MSWPHVGCGETNADSPSIAAVLMYAAHISTTPTADVETKF